MSTAADRQRARRQRLANGKIQLTIEADEVALVEALVEARLLEPVVDHDRRAIEAATQKLLGWVIAE
jgi:hypothetical protein